jgi:hypothetical protein
MHALYKLLIKRSTFLVAFYTIIVMQFTLKLSFREWRYERSVYVPFLLPYIHSERESIACQRIPTTPLVELHDHHTDDCWITD